jgi:hypothetical protein
LRHLVAPGFVAALVIGAIIAPLQRWIARLWGFVLLQYGIVSAVASIRQSARDGWDLLPRLPLVFATIHLAWGSGFWAEALRKFSGK